MPRRTRTLRPRACTPTCTPTRPQVDADPGEEPSSSSCSRARLQVPPPVKRLRVCLNTLPQAATEMPCRTRTLRPRATPPHPQVNDDPGEDPSRHPAGNTARDPDVAPAGNTARDPDVAPAGNTARDPDAAPAGNTARDPDVAPAGNTARDPDVAPAGNTARDPDVAPAGNTARDPDVAPAGNTARDPDVAPAWNTTRDPDVAPAGNTASDPDVAPAGNTARDPDVAPAWNTTRDPDVAPAWNTTRDPDVAPAGNTARDPDVAPAGNPTRVPDVAPAWNTARDPDVAPAWNTTRVPDVAPAWNTARDPDVAPAWNTTRVPDAAPRVSRFQPARPPGVQLDSTDDYTPLDLFKLFVPRDAVNTLCKNTNKQAAKAQAKGSKYKWTDVGIEEFYRYIGLMFYMAMVKLHTIKDYWRQNSIFSCPFPATIMSRDRNRAISWNVHMSDPDKDQENDRKQGTPQYDELFGLRPFMDTIQNACKAFFQPRRNISVDERMVGWKAKSLEGNSKLVLLCDSSTGYIVDFRVYPGKNNFQLEQEGLAYDTVMSLVNRNYLGSGYHVYMDSFYTSPKLFRDLLALKIGACGTYRDNRKDCPRTESNALTKKSPRGSIRWIRDGPLVFVKWMDTKVVPVCSTIHAAFTGDTVERRVKKDGVWISKDLPCPLPIIHYHKHMGGVDMCDQLTQYYTAQHKTMEWCRKMFLHLLDIAATNAYHLHKELASLRQEFPMTHKAFQEELVAQLCGVAQKIPPTQAAFDHVPVPTATQTLPVDKVASVGSKKCILCHKESGKQQSTPWKCKACDVPLCLQLTRNCFEKWHQRL